jgi:hypothetical protein
MRLRSNEMLQATGASGIMVAARRDHLQIECAEPAGLPPAPELLALPSYPSRKVRMDIRSLTGAQLLAAIALYWTVLALGWALYVRRPGLAARQAAARAVAQVTVEPGPHPDEHRVTFTSTVDLTRPLLLVVVPPALLAVVWLLA